MVLGAYSIVHQEFRGWSEGTGALPFLAATIGTISVSLVAPLTQKAYIGSATVNGGFARPEVRLLLVMIGANVSPQDFCGLHERILVRYTRSLA